MSEARFVSIHDMNNFEEPKMVSSLTKLNEKFEIKLIDQFISGELHKIQICLFFEIEQKIYYTSNDYFYYKRNNIDTKSVQEINFFKNLVLDLVLKINTSFSKFKVDIQEATHFFQQDKSLQDYLKFLLK